MSSDTIIQAARELVASSGLDALSMDEVAERAGISRSTLYRRIGGREELLAELRERGVEVPETVDARERILEATAELVGRRGRIGATVAEIAEEAGVNKVTIFRHFDDKASLLEVFAESVIPRGEVEAIFEDESSPLPDQLRAVAGIMLRTMSEYPGLLGVRLMLTEQTSGLEPVRRSGRRASRMLAERLERAMAEGALEQQPTSVLVSYFVSLVATQPAVRRRHRPEADIDFDAESRRMVRMFLREFGTGTDDG